MKSILHILSQTISALLYPLLIPTYGIILFCLSFNTYRVALPPVYWIITISGTLILTFIIPLSLILIDIKRGHISDIYINNPAERTKSYIYTICCYAFWCYFLHSTIHAPIFLTISGIGATIALICVTIINRKWKISAHMTGWGGLLGGIASACLFYGIIMPTGYIIGLSAMTILLMWARIYVQAHTANQTTAGLLLGLSFTSLPYITIETVITNV